MGKNERIYLNTEESLKEFKENMEYYLKRQNFHEFALSLNKEIFFTNIKESIKSKNDEECFKKFINKNRPKHISKRSDGNEGTIYEYEKYEVWVAKKTANTREIEETWEKNFKKTPSFFLINGEKHTFSNFEFLLYTSLNSRKKWIAMIINK